MCQQLFISTATSGIIQRHFSKLPNFYSGWILSIFGEYLLLHTPQYHKENHFQYRIITSKVSMQTSVSLYTTLCRRCKLLECAVQALSLLCLKSRKLDCAALFTLHTTVVLTTSVFALGSMIRQFLHYSQPSPKF